MPFPCLALVDVAVGAGDYGTAPQAVDQNADGDDRDGSSLLLLLASCRQTTMLPQQLCPPRRNE